MNTTKRTCEHCRHWGGGLPVLGFKNECVPLKNIVEVCANGFLVDDAELDDVNTPPGFGCDLWSAKA